jgi:predicted amidohydrolase
MTIALVSDLFFGNDSERCLCDRLEGARAAGATLAVLPELPLDPWYPAGQEAGAEESEAPGGRRFQTIAKAASAVGIGVVGGAIVQVPNSAKQRHNTTLIFDERGNLVGEYRKCHLPHEPGFWERSHYEAGDQPPAPFRTFAIPFGVQVCSDANRPAGSQVLAALGAELIVVPRATDPKTYSRWRLVFQSIAITCCVFVASVNRPRPESGVEIGGPSVVVGPDGQILLETTAPVAALTIDAATVDAAKSTYPGYLAIRADLYARAWAEVGQSRDFLIRATG